MAVFVVITAASRADALYSRTTVVSVNVGISAVLGAIGAAYNAEPGLKLKKFCEGFFYGSLGGGLIWLGKYTATDIPDHGVAGWTSKGLVSTGSSITENILNGRPAFSSWSMDFGPLWLSFSRKRYFDLKALPVSTGAMFYAATLPGSRIDLKKTLRTGTFTFRAKKPPADFEQSGALTIGNSVMIFENFPNNEDFFPHEVIHAYQGRQAMIIDSTYERYFERNVFTKHLRPDFFPALVNRSEHLMGYTRKKRNNFEENEADYFSTLYQDKLEERRSNKRYYEWYYR